MGIDTNNCLWYDSVMFKKYSICDTFSLSRRIVLYPGDCMDLLQSIPDESMQLIVTSPPYNIGKEYEKKLNSDTD
jgi:hypothetical protein